MEGGTQSNEHALQNAIQDNHTELISKIHELQTTVQECKDAQVQKQQKEAENEERTRKEQVPSTSNLLHLAQKLLEIRDSQRRSSIRDSATSQNSQSIIFSFNIKATVLNVQIRRLPIYY